MEIIEKRRSIRAFKSDPVSDEDLKKILNAARWAPSARNTQPWNFIVIKNQETLKRIAEQASYGKFIVDAPVAIAFVTNPNLSRWHIIDGSLATQNLMLAAHELGLGTCWIGTMNRDKVKEILNIPDELHLLTVIPVGYPEKERKGSRKDLSEFIHSEKFGSNEGFSL